MDAARAVHRTVTPAASANRRAVAAWLLACAAMVLVMTVIGGLTRLTGSGLSIVEWQPIAGILPPLTEAHWQALFEKYQATPEFQRLNFWMALDDFKAIFWLEYLHRVWGRLIGVAFLVPFLWFLARRWVDGRLALRLAAIFALGAAQGLLGWLMVESGLAERPAVSQYRLAAHLGLAAVIYALLLWAALQLVWPVRARAAPRVRGRLIGHARLVLGWSLVTILSGALVAGLHAGLAYNTFPLMDGALVPHGAFALEPWPVNFFENAATVQLSHRVLAIGLVAAVLALWWRGRARALAGRARRALDLLALAALVQLGLGIATLLLVVPVALAALHQAGAMAVLTFALWSVHELRAEPRTP